ncbi:ATP-binding protein [Nocardioides marmorisolisilvae]|uniref:ATP-binding protein n=1 Tax=Nocardioides marmorisolisilvae TaxID=1542737 RepID=A0A3N0DTY3_9ACTN|nr:ATP-binding protein [Nocardioides marmorisolisilvae]RNL78981.1 ATP-binding protein [Nocardioides marmorisolisilvae]
MKRRFSGDLKAPASARSFVIGQLEAALAGHAEAWTGDVVLVVSELVTNSVRAGAGHIDVDLRADARRVDLKVADDAPGWPTPRTAAYDDLDGRGLAIVDELAHRWTTSPGNPGKSVTATWFRAGS